MGHDDIISMEYDGELKKLSLKNFKTDALICTFMIAVLKTTPKYYYPAISLRDRGDSVQIVQ